MPHASHGSSAAAPEPRCLDGKAVQPCYYRVGLAAEAELTAVAALWGEVRGLGLCNPPEPYPTLPYPTTPCATPTPTTALPLAGRRPCAHHRRACWPRA